MNSEFTLLRTSKDKPAVLHRCYYYNHQRDLLKSNKTAFKCRVMIDVGDNRKECSGSFTINKSDNTYCFKEHQHEPLKAIECEIKVLYKEISNEINTNPSISIAKLYNEKQIQLVLKYGAETVAQHWPEFYSIDSAFFKRKNKKIPTLPKSLDDLKDLPENYKVTIGEPTKRFLLNTPTEFKDLILFGSDIGLKVLANSETWFCDGTFKSAPQFFYQHYIIHGKYINKKKETWQLPAIYSFLTGKTYEKYTTMIDRIKDSAELAGLELNPQVIMVDYEKAAIKAFRRAFPEAKLSGCHFHFTSAIYKKVSKLGMTEAYSNDIEFSQWIKTFMSFPFLMLSDIDDCWSELLDNIPNVARIDEMIDYINETWINTNAHFSRNVWNLFKESSSRTNNICESYNHKINGFLNKPHPNIYKMIDILKKEECSMSVDFERANDHGKYRKTKDLLKDKDILILKTRYECGKIEVMDYLLELTKYIKCFEL